jgi:hypothetical protein
VVEPNIAAGCLPSSRAELINKVEGPPTIERFHHSNREVPVSRVVEPNTAAGPLPSSRAELINKEERPATIERFHHSNREAPVNRVVEPPIAAGSLPSSKAELVSKAELGNKVELVNKVEGQPTSERFPHSNRDLLFNLVVEPNKPRDLRPAARARRVRTFIKRNCRLNRSVRSLHRQPTEEHPLAASVSGITPR